MNKITSIIILALGVFIAVTAITVSCKLKAKPKLTEVVQELQKERNEELEAVELSYQASRVQVDSLQNLINEYQALPKITSKRVALQKLYATPYLIPTDTMRISEFNAIFTELETFQFPEDSVSENSHY